VPIFEGGKLRANIKLADLDEKEAAVDYARVVLNAMHEVENALVAYGTEQRRRDALAATLAQNRDTFALAGQRYRSGLTSFLDVLDAERSEEQTELALAVSNAAVSTDLVALYKALGGGWAEEQKDAAVCGRRRAGDGLDRLRACFDRLSMKGVLPP
jgi:outer membrane protein TolC